MTLRIDEALQRARAARLRLREGEDAVAALRWLDAYSGAPDQLALACRSASLFDGYEPAMAYLKIELEPVLAGLIERAKRNAQRDMDRCLGTAL